MTLIWHSQGLLARPVVLVYDGSESAQKGLKVAVHLRKSHDSGLIVYLVADSQEAAQKLRGEVSDKLKEKHGNVIFRMIRSELKTLSRMLKSENAGPVVLPCDNHLSGDRLCCLLDKIPNPVLLIR
jgi:hypothetical protein